MCKKVNIILNNKKTLLFFFNFNNFRTLTWIQLFFELLKILFIIGKEIFLISYLVFLTLFRFAFYLMSSNEEEQLQTKIDLKQSQQRLFLYFYKIIKIMFFYLIF